MQYDAGANPKQSQGPLNLPYRGGISHNRLRQRCGMRVTSKKQLKVNKTLYYIYYIHIYIPLPVIYGGSAGM